MPRLQFHPSWPSGGQYGWRRHQDQDVPPLARTPPALHRCPEPPLWDKRTCEHTTNAECGCLVFASRAGGQLDAHNVRRDFRKVVTAAGLTGKDWTPRELRHSFVSQFRRRHPAREHLPPRRPPHHDGHRDRLPQATPADHQRRSHCDGPNLPLRSSAALRQPRTAVTQSVTHRLADRRPERIISQVGATGFEPVTPRL